jgi:hypothetical protein
MEKSKKKKSNERNSPDALYCKRDKALERLVAAFEKYGAAGEDHEDELNTALDALTIAHVAVTFEWANGPHKW